MKKKLYIVRHGQTEMNKKGLIQGWLDSNLTDLGKKQADATRKYFAKKKITFDHAYSSKLDRTRQTLKRITDLPIVQDERLNEFNFGEYDGKPVSDLSKIKIDLDNTYKEKGGETRQEVTDRMHEVLKEIMDKKDNQNVIVCSHGACSFRFAESVDKEKAKKLRKFENCIIYEYEYEDGKFKLVDIIDEHVKKLK